MLRLPKLYQVLAGLDWKYRCIGLLLVLALAGTVSVLAYLLIEIFPFF